MMLVIHTLQHTARNSLNERSTSRSFAVLFTA